MTASAAPVASVPAPPDVSVVIVSFNTRALLDACLSTVLASIGVRLEVFVVDNASHDGSPEHVAATFPDVCLIRNPRNRGFAAANNVAIPQASGRYVLLLNPDTLVDTDTIARLAGLLDARAEVGITGPKVLNRDGSLQSCGYWFPRLREEILLSRNVRKLARGLLGDPRTPPDPQRSSEVEWVDGCCLMIRRAVIDGIGLLDEQYFLYAEELDWCRSARDAGWRIATCPTATMVHLQGQSSQQVKAAALALLVETRLRYYRKQDGLLTAVLVSVVYGLGCARRWAVEPDKSRAKMRGVTQWWMAVAPFTRPALPGGLPPGASSRAS
jgi:N-acetylglucosaminyl-diphospho-decaprenol L-rhamnosyltransferase